MKSGLIGASKRFNPLVKQFGGWQNHLTIIMKSFLEIIREEKNTENRNIKHNN